MTTFSHVFALTGRHSLPADVTVTVLLPEELPFDMDELERLAHEACAEHVWPIYRVRQEVRPALIVSGFTPALIAILNQWAGGKKITLLHWDRARGEYAEQAYYTACWDH